MSQPPRARNSDVARLLDKYGQRTAQGDWATIDPRVKDQVKTIAGSKIAMAGEYSKMQDTFKNLGFGLILRPAAEDSWIDPALQDPYWKRSSRW